MYEYAISKGGHIMNLHGRDFLKLIDYTPEVDYKFYNKIPFFIRRAISKVCSLLPSTK